MRRSPILLLAALLVAPAYAQDTALSSVDTLIQPARFPWSATTYDRSALRSDPTRSLEGLLIRAPGITKVSTQPRAGMMGGSQSPYYFYYSTQPRSVTTVGGLHVRGNRELETEYRFGGISVLDRWTNTNGVPFIPEMLEQVTVHTGAYGPDLGSMGGGVVDMRLREGGETFTAEASFLTDDFARPGEQFLSTSSYGWTTAVITIGTPLPFNTKLFVAGEVSRQANRQPTYLDPIEMAAATDPVSYYASYYGTVPGPFVIGRNHVPMQSAERSALQWNLTSVQYGFDISLIGSISSGKKRDVTWPLAVANYYRLQRQPWLEENATLIALRVGTALTERFKVHLSATYQGSRSFTSDPDFGEAWRLYGDSLTNAEKGYLGFRSRYWPPITYSAAGGFMFKASSTPNDEYQRSSTEAWKWSAGATVRPSNKWTASFLGELESWTLRMFRVGSIYNGYVFSDINEDGATDRTFASLDEERMLTKKNRWINNFGYTFNGVETDNGIEAPRRPSVMSLSANTDWRDEGLTINVGLRAVWLDMDMPTVPKQVNPANGIPDWQYMDDVWDYNLATFKWDKLTRSETESYVLPRVSISHATSDGRLFVAYGSFAETSPYQFLQQDELTLAQLLDPLRRVGYNIGGPALTMNVKASRTAQLEFGVEHRIIGPLTGRASAFHKKLSQQVQMARVWNSQGYPITVAFDNSGEGSITGFDIGIKIDPASDLSADLTYAWMSAQGYGSFPRSNQYYVTDDFSWDQSLIPPKAIRPLSYQRTHRIVGSIELHPREGWLHGLHLAATAMLESGTPYTQLEPIMNLGSAGPWIVGVRQLIDIRSSSPVEPLNASVTPWTSNIDLSASYEVGFGPATVTLFALVTNVFDTKNVINVYPNSGTHNDDTWLRSPYAVSYLELPQYAEFYRAINLKNRWAYMTATGNDIYGAPRQIRVGARVTI